MKEQTYRSKNKYFNDNDFLIHAMSFRPSNLNGIFVLGGRLNCKCFYSSGIVFFVRTIYQNRRYNKTIKGIL